MNDNDKIVYCQQWEDGGYSLHRIKPNVYEFIKQETADMVEVSKEIGAAIIVATQGEPFLTHMNATDCADTLMTPEGRQTSGVKRYGKCPPHIKI